MNDYGQWARQLSGLNPNFAGAVFPKPNDDYNYYLGYLSGIKPELNKDDGQVHLTDIGKRPNHPTYSNESAYAKVPSLQSMLPGNNTPQPGQWMGFGDDWRYHNPSRGLFYAPEQDAYRQNNSPSMEQFFQAVFNRNTQR